MFSSDQVFYYTRDTQNVESKTCPLQARLAAVQENTQKSYCFKTHEVEHLLLFGSQTAFFEVDILELPA